MTSAVDELKIASDLHKHLGSPMLPKSLMDDRDNLIDGDKRTDQEVLLDHFREDSLHAIKTVRFLKDFIRYKAAPDLKTTNESFLRTAELFRLQGNKNYYFMLQLNNPALQGVDPYDPDLTPEQMTMIAEECRTNFWYFLREVCKLKPSIKFKANRGNISFIWSYLNHLTTYMIMPRQQGKLQEYGTKILRADGSWTNIEKIKLGDELLNAEGETARVIGVHPQGERRLYKVTTSDGRTLNTGAQHLWTVNDEHRGRTGAWVDYSTAQLIELFKEERYTKTSIELPLIQPHEFPDKELINPYFMGLFYAGIQNNNESILTNLDPKVNEELNTIIPSCFTTSINLSNDVSISNRNATIFKYVDAGLTKDYLSCSIEQRLELINGLMDANGSVRNAKGFLPIEASKLSDDIQYVVRSLGGTAKRVEDGLELTLPEEFNLFKLREVDTSEIKNELFIETIEYSHYNDAVCIEVDSQDQLYVTDNFIVTHNTVSVQVINFWLTYIVGRGYKSHLITLKSDNRAQFIEAIKSIRSSIPKYLMNSTYRDKDSGTYLTYRSFGENETNVMTISVPQQSEAAAGDLGRGLTVGTTTIDEPSYINYIEAIVNGCAPSALTEMKNSRENGLPYCISYITTPNTILHPSGEYMYDKVMSSTEWREKFFDSYSESHLIDRLKKASPKETTSPSISMVYNYLQLGKGPDWVKETIDQLGLSISKAKIDLLLMWVEDGEDKLFDDLTREAINNSKREVIWSKEYKRSGLFLDMFIPKEEFVNLCRSTANDFVLIGSDTSSAVNQDACTVVLRSFRTGKVIGVGRYPIAFLDDVGGVLVDLLSSIENSMLIIERNYAHHMIDSILISLNARGLDPFKKLYNQIYQDPVKFAKEIQELKRVKVGYRDKDFYLKYKKYFGFNTNASSRATLYGFIQEAVGNTGYGLGYDKLCDELINLRVKGGRIDHDNNKHDDLVIAWLLSYWFIKLGNSKSMYGIPVGIGLTETKNILVNTESHVEPIQDPDVIKFTDAIKLRINRLSDELISTTDDILAIRLENEIIKLSRLVPNMDTKTTVTIDSVLNEAKIERNRRIMRNKKIA